MDANDTGSTSPISVDPVAGAEPPAPTSEPPQAPKVSFDDLGLLPELLRAVKDNGYTHPTPIQAQAIPIIMSGKDVMGGAQTGTGKTAG
mgnify:CR=1 FL=1